MHDVMNLIDFLLILATMDSLDLVSPYLFKHKGSNFLVKDKMQPEDLDALQYFEIRSTDVFLISYPKSGHMLPLIFIKDHHLQ